MLINRNIILLIFTGFLFSCKKDVGKRLDALDSTKTNIKFKNEIVEDEEYNILDFHYCYNGGGVGVGDFNQDGLQDLYFTGNQTSSKLYLNQGDFKFVDVTLDAKVATDRWCTGVSIIDFNQDHWPDIYISVAGPKCPTNCENYLFINQGLSSNNIPFFKEEASKYQLEDPLYTQQAVFFDFDKDGDQDVYLLRNFLDPKDKNSPSPERYLNPKMKDALLVNKSEDGQIRYDDQSEVLGISHKGYGLGIALNDFNQDGWVDFYIANDFLSPSRIYLNKGFDNKDQFLGFKEVSAVLLAHQSYNGMGVSAADMNNDGLPDILELDMLPETNEAKKQMIGFMNYDKFKMGLEEGYAPQFMENTFQLNNGMLKGEMLPFSEIGNIAGLDATGWSWAPLVFDMDNDGWKDVYITNGYVKDITDLDFINFDMQIRSFGSNEAQAQQERKVLSELKGLKQENKIYKNIDGIQYASKEQDWIAESYTFSNGAVHVDLDNDGDQDLVINNINSEASVIRNHAKGNYLTLDFGNEKPVDYQGATVKIFYNDKEQTQFVFPTLAYLSSSDSRIHFGIDSTTLVDSLLIKWPDFSIQKLQNITANQILKIRKQNSSPQVFLDIKHSTLFESEELPLTHIENRYSDFDHQHLLMHMHSTCGPALAMAELNNYGGEEIFMGGAFGKNGVLYSKEENTFQEIPSTDHEDVDAEFFDYDNDGDLDLYVCSGGSEFEEGHDYYQDRIYTNTNGKFALNTSVLPDFKISSSCVRVADFDNDGDQDLFVGARLNPRKYPSSPQSYLLENKNGEFILRNEWLPNNGVIGMITDAEWHDLNGDQKIDLILVGEASPVQTFINQGVGKGFKVSNPFDQSIAIHGFWNTIEGADFDNDGDIDFMIGNMGTNSRLKANQDQPIRIINEDLDQNGSLDPLIASFALNRKGIEASYLFHSRDDIMKQLVLLKSKYLSYASFASLGSKEIIEFFKKAPKSLLVDELETIYLENKDGNFTKRKLPQVCQYSTIKGIAIADVNKDGHLDAVFSGNDYSTESNQGFFDANIGIVLMGDGKGNFKPMATKDSGYFVNGDSRTVKLHKVNNEITGIVTARSDGNVILHQIKNVVQ